MCEARWEITVGPDIGLGKRRAARLWTGGLPHTVAAQAEGCTCSASRSCGRVGFVDAAECQGVAAVVEAVRVTASPLYYPFLAPRAGSSRRAQ